MMSKVKLNGVFKMKGRPTLVEGLEGRRYVANKILNNLESSHGGGRAYMTPASSSYSGNGSYLPGLESEFGVDDYGLSTESLNEANPDDASAKGGELQEGFALSDVLKACREDNEDSQAEEPASNVIEFAKGEKRNTDHLYFWGEDDEAQSGNDGLLDEIDEYFDCAMLDPDQVEKFRSPEDRSNKTEILRIPNSGVVRSCRGTVELLVHANGRTFKPQYNMCGILLTVTTSDGFQFINKGRANWKFVDGNGIVLEADKIHTVAFDKKGNLWYQTVTGKRVIFAVDGSTEMLIA